MQALKLKKKYLENTINEVSGPDGTRTYLLTPCCRVLLEKLTGLQLVKKFLAFHGIRRFITALTSVRHLSLSWVSPIQSIYPRPTSWISVLILSTHLRLGLPSGLFPSGHQRNNNDIKFKAVATNNHIVTNRVLPPFSLVTSINWKGHVTQR